MILQWVDQLKHINMKEFKLILILFLWLGVVLHSQSQSGYIYKAVDSKHKVTQSSTVYNVTKVKQVNKTVNNLILFDYIYDFKSNSTGVISISNSNIFNDVYLRPSSGIWNNPNMSLDRKNNINNLNHRFKWKY